MPEIQDVDKEETPLVVARGPVSQLRNLGGIINKLDDPAASSGDMEFNN